MTDVPSLLTRIQVESCQVRGVVSEYLAQLLGGTMNWIIDHITIPVGTIFDFAGTALPSGWLACDGSVVSQETYADLYAAIGTTWDTGGEGAGNFRLPNFTDRYARGDGNGKAVGDYLDAALPAHTHSAEIVTGAGPNPYLNGSYGVGGVSRNVSGGSIGDGTELRPKTAVVMKIIKY